MNKFTGKIKSHNAIYPVLSLFLVCVYFLTLHPISGFIGGFFFYFLEWLVPSAINILLSIWLVRLFIKKNEQRKIAFIIFSVLLGLNTNLFVPFTHYQNSKVTKSIGRVLNPEKGISLTINDNDILQGILLPKNPYAAPVSVTGNEGCMCFYFDTSEGILREFIRQLYLRFTVSPDSNAKLVLNVEEKNSKAGITIKISQDEKLISSFKMESIPAVNIKGRYGRENKLLNGHFIQNTVDMLAHNNLWSYVFGYIHNIINGSQLDEIELFLRESVSSRLD